MVPDSASLPTRVGFISSMLLGLALGRYVLRLAPVRTLERRQIIANLGPVLQEFACGRLN